MVGAMSDSSSKEASERRARGSSRWYLMGHDIAKGSTLPANPPLTSIKLHTNILIVSTFREYPPLSLALQTLPCILALYVHHFAAPRQIVHTTTRVAPLQSSTPALLFSSRPHRPRSPPGRPPSCPGRLTPRNRGPRNKSSSDLSLPRPTSNRWPRS
jgi:hypothetical protein